MAERTDSQFSKIHIREVGQKREIDVVLGECGRISPESELFQPNVDFRRRAARSLP